MIFNGSHIRAQEKEDDLVKRKNTTISTVKNHEERNFPESRNNATGGELLLYTHIYIYIQIVKIDFSNITKEFISPPKKQLRKFSIKIKKK